MAINNLMVSGAGITNANGTYEPIYWEYGYIAGFAYMKDDESFFILQNSMGKWIISDADETNYYIDTAVERTYDPPDMYTYEVYEDGEEPPPTITEIGAGSGGTSAVKILPFSGRVGL